MKFTELFVQKNYDALILLGDRYETLEVLSSIGFVDCKYAICTYHPVIMNRGSVDGQILELLEAIKAFPDIEFIVTKSNADQGGARINELLDDVNKKIRNLHLFTSLGIRRYLSLMKYSEFVLGNSSGGIIEAPTFCVPTVNIGERQLGRLQSASIINCEADRDSLISAIRVAISEEYKTTCKNVIRSYGSGNAAIQIANKVIETMKNEKINLKKKFYNL